MWWIFLHGALLAGSVLGVDRSNFKTCSQSGFCKRQRDYNPGTSPYKALLETAHSDASKFSVQLLNVRNQVRLQVDLLSVKGNMARLKIKEAEPIKERYEIPVGDCLVKEPDLDRLEVKGSDASSYTFGFGSNKIVLQAEPFRLDLMVDNEPTMSVNSKGLLKFEHYRQKEGAPEEEVAADGGEQPQQQEPVAAEEEEGDLWEETFKSHKDTKPFGPSSVGVDITFNNFEHVYGIPEHADSVALKNTKDGDPYRLYNLDVFEYELDNPMALYGSVPLMYAHNEAGTVGVFWQNAAETWVDVRSTVAEKREMFDLRYKVDSDLQRLVNIYKSKPLDQEMEERLMNYKGKIPESIDSLDPAMQEILRRKQTEMDEGAFSKLVDMVKGDSDIPQVDTHWMSESGIIDVFFLMGPTANQVFRQYATLTGTTPLPPLWAIAYHQSRWNYNDEEDVANVDAGFDNYDIPMDVIWLDIEHTDGKRYFTWDKQKFPNPAEMINKVASKGRKMVTIIDPHIKKDANYHIHSQAQSGGHYIKNKDGNDYEGWCWPGSSGWLDFVSPAVREFWASKFALSEYEGSTLDLYTWNDMNEPSVFNGPEITMHKDAKHYGDWEHRDVHNIYGTYVHRASVEGQLMRAPDRRPFVLSRAFFSGTQRYGAVWTGDNTGEWGHLKISIPMLLSLNLVGITFSGADIGGFFKNPDNELLTRWYQAAAYQPFFRAHAHLDTKRREPWLLPDHNMAAIRAAIRARYALLPYWYTLFYFGERDGGPIMKPLWIDFPKDKETFAMDDQFLVGDALLVHPVTDAGATGVSVYFPGQADVWYDTDSYKAYNGGQRTHIPVTLDKIPVYQRGGTIVPRKERIRRAATLTYSDPYTLVVALSKAGRAEGNLYIDQYDAFGYREGIFALRKFTFENNKLVNRDIHPSGVRYATKSWLERVVIVGVTSQPSAVEISGTGFQASSLDFKYDSSTRVLVVRKPGVNMNSDWSISLS